MPKTPPLSEIDRYIGAQIRKHRRAAEWSQGRLAEVCGVSYQQMSKSEAGGNHTSATRLYQIAKALGVPVADFFPKE